MIHKLPLLYQQLDQLLSSNKEHLTHYSDDDSICLKEILTESLTHLSNENYRHAHSCIETIMLYPKPIKEIIDVIIQIYQILSDLKHQK
jgi:hypothetical protein